MKVGLDIIGISFGFFDIQAVRQISTCSSKITKTSFRIEMPEKRRQKTEGRKAGRPDYGLSTAELQAV
jgi:hypothetical protein